MQFEYFNDTGNPISSSNEIKEQFPAFYYVVHLSKDTQYQLFVDGWGQYVFHFRVDLGLEGVPLSDVSTFLNAPHVVLGQGTFAYSISMASPYLKNLHIFDNMVWTLDPIWNKMNTYVYRAPEYVFAMWPWLNKEEQRELMFKFPEGKIQNQKLRCNIDCNI